MTRTAHRQPALPLSPAGDDWRLDPRTREVGRRGLAEARAALAAAARRAEARFPDPGARRAA
jgi:hypothetical protein